MTPHGSEFCKAQVEPGSSAVEVSYGHQIRIPIKGFKDFKSGFEIRKQVRPIKEEIKDTYGND